ncbi:MAG TPA: phosphoglycerate mutase family protein [Chitinophagaceae bacterium]|jgi:broad specificity phosphatase PhoE|nr:phosphoglycerate mutase family protein [Chitinophagaceae bacterium]
MRSLLYVALVLLISSCSNRIYIVRHAEKAKPLAGMPVLDANDPPLSDSGNLRALALKMRLQSENIRHIFSTNYKRTLNTAKPLDEQLLSVQTQLYSPKKDSTDAFIALLKSIKKGNVLVVGHSNTIDDLANKLAGSTVVAGDLPETDYDNIFILKRKGNKYRFSGETYGAPTQ